MEARAAIVVPFIDDDFPGLAAVARVETHGKRGGKPKPVIVRYFVLSTILTAQRMIEVARAHWTTRKPTPPGARRGARRGCLQEP